MRWISNLNLFLLSLILLTVILLIFLSTSRQPNLSISEPIVYKELPKSPFSLSEEAFLAIGEGPFSLKWAAPKMQLPDLRKELLILGKNGRPDATRNTFHIALRGSIETFAAKEDEKIYLNYESFYKEKNSPSEIYSPKNTPIFGEISEKQKEPFYTFCPPEKKSSLWIELKQSGPESMEVFVGMLDETRSPVREPQENSRFMLPYHEFQKSPSAGWELGKYRVDTTLLVRQKARWIGQDIFLQMHGGEDYGFVKGKEKIDFLDGAEPYSCFLSENDRLIWVDDRWKLANEKTNTSSYPLLFVKKVDDKIMTFDLWDVQGKGKLTMSIVRMRDHSGFPEVSREFKFVGVKTWAQYLVECGQERMTLKPNDWLVLTSEGWKKLDSIEALEDFVSGKLSGPLFVLDRLVKQSGRQSLVGHVFNQSRSEVEEVELIANANAPIANHFRALPSSPPIHPEIKGRDQ